MPFCEFEVRLYTLCLEWFRYKRIDAFFLNKNFLKEWLLIEKKIWIQRAFRWIHFCIEKNVDFYNLAYKQSSLSIVKYGKQN